MYRIFVLLYIRILIPRYSYQKKRSMRKRPSQQIRRHRTPRIRHRMVRRGRSTTCVQAVGHLLELGRCGFEVREDLYRVVVEFLVIRETRGSVEVVGKVLKRFLALLASLECLVGKRLRCDRRGRCWSGDHDRHAGRTGCACARLRAGQCANGRPPHESGRPWGRQGPFGGRLRRRSSGVHPTVVLLRVARGRRACGCVARGLRSAGLRRVGLAASSTSGAARSRCAFCGRLPSRRACLRIARFCGT